MPGALEPARGLKTILKDRVVVSWALYDWANSAFATTVIAGFFQVFFKKYWSAGIDVHESTYLLGWANSLSAAALAALSPILGAFADRGSHKKRMLMTFTFLGVAMTAALSMVPHGDWKTAALIYVFASIGFAGANVPYDALLIFVARGPRELNVVSAIGFSFGYLGGGLLFAVNVLMTQKPEWFGLASATAAVKASFVCVALWWALFTIPLLLFVKEEEGPPSPGFWRTTADAFAQVARTFQDIRALRNVSTFLVAYFFYIDGVNTMIRMAVDYGLSLGLPESSLIVALLMVQFIGFPAAIAYGILAEKIGARRGIYLAIAIYAAVTLYGYFMKTALDFFVLAGAIGLAQGGIQSLSRSVFASMTPREKETEFLGFFNMLGKFSSMMGPVLVGWVAVATQSSRLSILSLLLLFAVGAFFLAFVRFEAHSSHSSAA